jgi:hypothetical protein
MGVSEFMSQNKFKFRKMNSSAFGFVGINERNLLLSQRKKPRLLCQLEKNNEIFGKENKLFKILGGKKSEKNLNKENNQNMLNMAQTKENPNNAIADKENHKIHKLNSKLITKKNKKTPFALLIPGNSIQNTQPKSDKPDLSNSKKINNWNKNRAEKCPQKVDSNFSNLDLSLSTEDDFEDQSDVALMKQKERILDMIFDTDDECGSSLGNQVCPSQSC